MGGFLKDEVERVELKALQATLGAEVENQCRPEHWWQKGVEPD